MIESLTEDTFLLFAVRAYNSPHFLDQEFFSDVKRVKYIKRLIQKYKKGKPLRLRLLLNHIVMFYNVFDTESCTRMLFLKIDEQSHDVLKTVLTFLGYMPDVVKDINGKDYFSREIELEESVKMELEQL